MNTQEANVVLAKTASLRKLWDAIGAKRLLMVLTLFVGLLDILVDSLGLSLSLRMVSNAALTRDLHAVYRAVTFLVSVMVFRALFAALGHYMTAQVTEDTALNLRGKVFRAIMGGKSVYFDTY